MVHNKHSDVSVLIEEPQPWTKIPRELLTRGSQFHQGEVGTFNEIQES